MDGWMDRWIDERMNQSIQASHDKVAFVNIIIIIMTLWCPSSIAALDAL